jgi:hypothetical protein
MTSGRAFRPTLGARTCAAVPAHLPFVMPTPPRGASTLTARPCVEIRAHATDQHHLAHILRVDHAGVVEDEQRRRLRLGPGRKPGLERTPGRQAWTLAHHAVEHRRGHTFLGPTARVNALTIAKVHGSVGKNDVQGFPYASQRCLLA